MFVGVFFVIFAFGRLTETNTTTKKRNFFFCRLCGSDKSIKVRIFSFFVLVLFCCFFFFAFCYFYQGSWLCNFSDHFSYIIIRGTNLVLEEKNPEVGRFW